jgi:integrase
MGREAWGSIRRLPSSRWQVRYLAGRGSKKMRTAPHTFATKTAAREWLNRQHAKIAAGDYVDPKLGEILFETYAWQWLDGKVLEDTSRDQYERRLRKHLIPAFGSERLNAISSEDVRRWHAPIARTHPALAAACYQELGNIFATAVTDGRLTKSPCIIKGAASYKAPRRRVGDEDEVLRAARLMPPYLRVLPLLCCWAELRRGEVFGLRRWGVVVEDQLIVVSPTVTWAGSKMVEKGPKTVAGERHAIVPARIMDVVAEHLDTHTRAGRDAYVIANRAGGAISRQVVYYHWFKARAAIGRPDLRLHDLRHSGSTLSSQYGATLAERMAKAGWSTPATAMRYDHSVDARQRLIAERMNATLEGAEVIDLAPERGRRRGRCAAAAGE